MTTIHLPLQDAACIYTGGHLIYVVAPQLELVSKELNHLAAILHVYAGGLNFMKLKKMLLFFKKKMEIHLHF